MLANGQIGPIGGGTLFFGIFAFLPFNVGKAEFKMSIVTLTNVRIAAQLIQVLNVDPANR